MVTLEDEAAGGHLTVSGYTESLGQSQLRKRFERQSAHCLILEQYWAGADALNGSAR